MAEKKKKPAHNIRLGRIRAAIWQNGETERNGAWFNVTVTRLHKEDGEWRDYNSFSRDDLPVVAKVMDMAYAWIWAQEAAPDRQQANQQES